jgi:hypothetical protein
MSTDWAGNQMPLFHNFFGRCSASGSAFGRSRQGQFGLTLKISQSQSREVVDYITASRFSALIHVVAVAVRN